MGHDRRRCCVIKEKCSVEGCDRIERLRRGFCGLHYNRWMKNGDVGPVDRIFQPGPGVCVVDECGLATYTSGSQHCQLHYNRMRTHGTTDATRPWHRRETCTVEGCDKPESGDLMCSMHQMRVQRHGDPFAVIQLADRDFLRRDANHRWTGEEATYAGVHQRVGAAMGRAKEYLCVDCGQPARHWSYDHKDPDERNENGSPYSVDLTHYEPRCSSCHKKLDNSVKPPLRASSSGCVLDEGGKQWRTA